MSLFFISCNKIRRENVKDNPKDTIKKPKNIYVAENFLEQVVVIEIDMELYFRTIIKMMP